MFAPTRGQKVGAIGFCTGGTLAGLLACHDPELGAAAIFDGGAPPESKLRNIQCPVAGFYGALDKQITGGVPGFAAAMTKTHKSFEVHIYDGARRAFFNDTRPSYDPRAARDAFTHVLAFFGRTLRTGNVPS